MTVLERKAKFIKAILSDDTDEAMMEDLETVFYSKFDAAPCQYSESEIRQRTRKALLEAKSGKVTSHQEMRKRFCK